MSKILYKNAIYRTHGDLPTIGSRAPDFSLVDTELRNVSLANWMGLRKVLNIFISLDTSVCGKSVMEFDRLAAQHDDTVVLMV
ncbi:MAG: redoxin family protein, partial [Gammaproteobacteria bacterium]|nr:redoxin family protein [Gammaproteobacteria bacterium]